MPSDSRRPRASPNHSASGGTSASSETKTRPASDSTRNCGSFTPSRSSAAKPRASGTAASWPSCRYVQPWYGQRRTFGQRAGAGEDLHRAVTAHVRERAQLAVVAAHDRDGLAGDVGRRERPRLAHCALGADEDPRAREDVVELGLVDLAIDVGAGRQGVRAVPRCQRSCRAAPMRLRGGRAHVPGAARCRRAAPAGRARRRARTAAPRSPASSTGGPRTRARARPPPRSTSGRTPRRRAAGPARRAPRAASPTRSASSARRRRRRRGTRARRSRAARAASRSARPQCG